MRRLSLALAAGLVAFPAYARDAVAPPVLPQPQNQKSAVDARTEQFIEKAVIGDLYEIQSSQLALEKTRNNLLGDYAKRMIAHHTSLSSELKSRIQGTKALQVPARLDARHKRMMEELRAASARQFGALYRTQQINAHDEAVRLFVSYSRDGSNARLKQFASRALPTLRAHRKMAQDLPPRGGPVVSEAARSRR